MADCSSSAGASVSKEGSVSEKPLDYVAMADSGYDSFAKQDADFSAGASVSEKGSGCSEDVRPKKREGFEYDVNGYRYPLGHEKYWEQVSKSEGFDIIDFPGVSAYTQYVPSNLAFEDEEKEVTDCAVQALKHYNKRFKKKTQKFVFSKLLWATLSACAGYTRCITYEAAKGGRTDDPAAVKKFQAKVYVRRPQMEIKVLFCRLRKEQEVDFKPFVYPPFEPVFPSDLTREDVKEVVTNCAIEALKHYNEQFKKHFVFSKLLRANKLIAADGLYHYIIFDAMEGAVGTKFQAKVFRDSLLMKIQVIFCRIRTVQVAFDQRFMDASIDDADE